LPCGHDEHLDFPGFAAMVPGAHCEHILLPYEDAEDPSGQGLHSGMLKIPISPILIFSGPGKWIKTNLANPTHCGAFIKTSVDANVPPLKQFILEAWLNGVLLPIHSFSPVIVA